MIKICVKRKYSTTEEDEDGDENACNFRVNLSTDQIHVLSDSIHKDTFPKILENAFSEFKNVNVNRIYDSKFNLKQNIFCFLEAQSCAGFACLFELCKDVSLSQYEFFIYVVPFFFSFE